VYKRQGGKEPWRPGTAAPEPTLADLMNSHLDERDRPVGLLPSGPVNGGHAAHASPPAMKQPEAAGHDAHVETPRPPATPAVNVAASISQPKVGDNVLDIRLTDAQGKPVIGAKVAVSVAMTNMDMGSARLAAKELGGGRYRATVNFSMAGPWRVTLTVMPPNGPTTAKPFDFQAR